MSDFIADLASPRWWMSVVVAGILVNMVATYLLRLLDSRLMRASDWWRRTRTSVQRERQATLDALRTEPQKQIRLQAAEVRYRLHSLVLLVQAVGMAVLVVLFITVGSPRWVVMPAIALFAVLWYAFVRESRLADHASTLLAEVHRE